MPTLGRPRPDTTLLSLQPPGRRPLARLTARVLIAALVVGLVPAPAPAAAGPVPAAPPLWAFPAPAVPPPAAVAPAAPAPSTLASQASTPVRALVPPPAPAPVPAPAPLAAPPARPRASEVRARQEASASRRAAAPPTDESLVVRTHTFPAGWNLVSVPLVPTNPSPQSVFADVPPPLYLYDYVGGHTLAVGEAGFRNVAPGRVYWLLTTNAVTVDVSGDLVATAEYRQTLTPGWNGVATPWLAPVDWADTRVSVRNGTSTLPLSEAIAQGWIEGDLTDHDPGSDTGIPIPPNTSPAGQLVAWKGYLLFSNVSGDLIFSSPPPDTDPPDVAFDPTLDGRAVTEPTPIIGSIGDENLVEWRLEVAPAEGGAFTLLGQGEAPVVNGTLGILDPTLLLNGIYVVRLTATDISGTTSTRTASVVVQGNQKVGQFSVSFTDLEVPVAGLPIRIVRTYDSRDKRRGDFGFGWRLHLSQLSVNRSGVPGEDWQGTQSGGPFPQYCIQPSRAHVVSITFPDGKVYEFEPVLTPSCQTIIPPQGTTVSFRARPGTLGTLTPIGGGDTLVLGNFPGPLTLLSFDAEPFDPDAYQLSLPDGRSFVVDRVSGLQSLTDRNGNQLTVGPGGVVHSSGRGVAFTRDGQGRITRITDPSGNFLAYAYDGNGDLVGATDREERTTTFTYVATVPHHLEGIHDPLGRTPVRNDYDEAGRLLRHTDALGNTVEYTNDVAGREQLVTDREGAVRRYIYDARGNVLQETDPAGKVTQRTFDARDNKLTETDPNGNTTTWVHDALDNVIEVRAPLGLVTRYTYNARRQVLTTTDPRGKVTTNTYDAAGNLLTVTDPVGTVTRFTYDAQGNVLTETVTVGGVDQVTTNTFDAFGNQLTATNALGHRSTYTYDNSGNRLTEVVTRTTPSGPETLTTTFTYDRQGRLLTTTDADGTVTRSVYDEMGRRVESYDKLNRKTTFEYDDMGRLTRTTHPDTTTEVATYDGEGRALTTQDRAGRITTFTYDAVGRLRRTTHPDGTFTENGFDDGGRLTSTRDARGNVTEYEYDDAGRQTVVRDALDRETTVTYDENGNQRTVLDARGNTTTHEYDDANRRVRTTFPDTSFSLVGYDSVGNVVSETDQAGKTTTFAWDAAGRLVRVTDALGKETSHAYDERGSRTSQTDALGHVTRFEYDRLGRETKRTLPDAKFETKAYDAAGNLRTRIDFAGRTTSYTYDLSDRLVSRTYPGSGQPPVGFTYTPTGKRLTATDARGTTTYTYDVRDRLTSLTYPDGRRLEYGWDGHGNRSSLTARIGTTTLATGYAYDALNRLQTVTDPLGRAYGQAYDENGNRRTLAYPNGTTTTYGYDALNRLRTLSTVGSLGTVQGYSFTLGPAGNRTRIDEADGTVRQYTHDSLYRLTGETISGGALPYAKTFTYDDVGNRLTQSHNGVPTGYTYDNRDRLLTEGGQGYTYDDNGNLLTKAGEASYTWDLENRLVRVTRADGGLIEHVYDPDGNRVQTQTTLPGQGTQTVAFLVDTSGPLSHVVVETDGTTGGVLAHYVRGDDLLSVIRSSGTRFYHADGVGSIRRLTDETGNVTDTYTYSAFGELLAHAGTDTQPYAFAGEPYDPNVGFTYHRARWMDPRVGRFVGQDVFDGLEYDPPSLHKYLYAHADPVDRTDPSGHFSLSGALTTIAVQVTLFTLRHPILTAVIGFVGNALIPAEVHNAMMGSGFPAFQAVGRVGRAEAAGIQLIKNWASRLAARRALGQISNAAGHAFERFAKRHLFPDFSAQEVSTGRHVLDLIWRNTYIELKTGRALKGRELSQLAEFSGAANAAQSGLAYVFLSKPTPGTMQKIQQAGGTVYYLFD
jgi:RHS repeat-associated protein